MLLALLLVAVPLAFAALAFALPPPKARPLLLPIGGAAHLAITGCALLSGTEVAAASGWLALDPVGKIVLGLVSVLFFASSLYAPGYLRLRAARPNRIFCAALFAFLGMMSLVTEAHQLGLLWVAVEATTLASAPLVYFNKNARSLEATWKYLLVGSVGIAMALLGTLFLAYAALQAGVHTSLVVTDLVAVAPQLSRPWLHAAFVLLFIGYGTKMGLAPMHTWKPDTYGEAPGVVGALLAGGLTSCAFLAVLRFFHVCAAAGEAAFARRLLVALGLLSMAIAGVFMARQRDFKRLLAYSSVEHMGILVLGVGIGGEAVFGSLLHLVNNGLTKGVLFLAAGNIHRAYGEKRIGDGPGEVAGALRKVPASAALLLAGFFAITGSPPFGPFLSEFTIARAAMSGGRFLVGGAFLVLLFVVFVGMGATILAVVQGEPRETKTSDATGDDRRFRDGLLTVGPPLALLALVLCLGVYVPPSLGGMLHSAAAYLEQP
jgi:hydrogenase-4 component F